MATKHNYGLIITTDKNAQNQGQVTQETEAEIRSVYQDDLIQALQNQTQDCCVL